MATPETRRQLLAAVAACEDKKGEDTRILALDPADSGLADFFLITSATNDRQVVAIADEIEMRLKKEFGIYPASVEGRRQAEWILLDYIDIVVHVFLAEKRAFYDIERLRKSARTLTPVEVEAEHEAALSAALAEALRERTREVRSHHPNAKVKKTATSVTPSKSPATKASPSKSSPKGDSKVTAKPAKKAAKKAATKPAKKSSAKVAGVVDPANGSDPGPAGARPPIIKRALGPIGTPVGARDPEIAGARPPVVKAEDPGAAAPAVKAPAKKAVKKAAKKAPVKAAKKVPVKAAKKAVKKAAKKSKGK